MITIKGVGFLLVAILVYVLARVTQVGWLYLIDALLWGIILLSAVLPWLGVVFLDGRRRLSDRSSPLENRAENRAEKPAGPAEGEPVQIELSLHNRVLFPRFFLRILYDCPFADPESRLRRFFVAKLDGSRRLPMESTVVAHQRGPHQLGPVEVESTAPFGMFRRRVRIAAFLRTVPVSCTPRAATWGVGPLTRSRPRRSGGSVER